MITMMMLMFYINLSGMSLVSMYVLVLDNYSNCDSFKVVSLTL